MNNKLSESIIAGISLGIRKALNEEKKENKKYTITYKTCKYMYVIEDDNTDKKSFKDTKINPKYIEFKENDLDKYFNGALEKYSDAIHICDPYNGDGKLCFDIESTIPFDTHINGYGPNTTLKDAIENYLQGQISDGWGENGVGYLKVKGKKLTIFV